MIGRALSHPPRGALAGALALAVLASALVACGPAATPPGAAASHARPPAVASQKRSPVETGVLLGATDPTRVIEFTLVLPGQAPRELARTLAALHDPHSPSYQRYLTPSEYAQRFGAAPQAQARVEAFLRAQSLTITQRTQNGELITARGTVARIEALFGVTLRDYQTADHQRYYAPTGAPQIPSALRATITGVLGLDTWPAFHSAGLRKLARPASGTQFDAYTPDDLERLYDIGPLHSAGLDGSRQTIALAEIDDLNQHAVDVYDQTYSLPTKPVESAGGTPESKDSGETTLDIEVIHAIAPKAHLITYMSQASYGAIAQTIAKIVNDNRAQIISISLGGCAVGAQQAHPEAVTTFNAAFQQAAAQGISVFVSSGDSGAYGCNREDPTDFELSTSVPADDPYVTAVGGTALFSGPDGGYAYEAGWEGPLSVSGSGGGLSVIYEQPAWQTGPGVSNQYSNGMRQSPDVAADADPMTGYRIYYEDGQCQGEECWIPMGGTSAAAPLWAALAALGNQQATAQGQPVLGFLNPALYQLAGQAASPSPFHDVIRGGNLYYTATPGWDYATGLGTPDAALLIKALLALPRATPSPTA